MATGSGCATDTVVSVADAAALDEACSPVPLFGCAFASYSRVIGCDRAGPC